MASSQEMQRRAKERRRLDAFLAEITDTRTRWVEALDPIQDRLSFRAPDLAEEVVEWFGYWADDYINPDKGNNARVPDIETAKAMMDYFWYICVDSQPVGFLLLKEKPHRDSPEPIVGIEIMYIQPQHRGRHLATAGYVWAVRAAGAQWIELSYDRVKPRIAYWLSLGFLHIAGSTNPNQNDLTSGSICILSQPETRIGRILTPDNVWKVRQDTNDYFIKAQHKELDFV